MEIKRVSIEVAAKQYKESVLRNTRLKQSSIKSRIDAIFYTYWGICALKTIMAMGVGFTCEINRTVIEELNNILDTIIVNLNQRTKIKSGVRFWLAWMMDLGMMEFDKTILRILKQKQGKPEKIHLPTRKQVDILENSRLGKTEFFHLMAWLLFFFLPIVNAVRPGEEIVNMDVTDIKIDLYKIRIHRKGGGVQWISFQKRYRAQIKRYLKLREDHLREFDAETETALFIKLCPTMGRKKNQPTWRLSKFGYWQKFRALQKTYKELRGIKCYWFRHLGCSIMAFNAVTYGGSKEETAFRNSHSVNMLHQYYDAFSGYRDELLTRRPEENITFIKEKIITSVKKLIRSPDNIEHLFSAIEWSRDLGLTQKNIDLALDHESDTEDGAMAIDGLEALKQDPRLCAELQAAIPGIIKLLKAAGSQSEPLQTMEGNRFLESRVGKRKVIESKSV